MGTKGALTLSTMFNITKIRNEYDIMLTLLNFVVLHRHTSYFLYFPILKSFIIKMKTFTEEKVESLLPFPD